MASGPTHYEAIVCGAGIAGIAAAHALTEAGLRNIALVDPAPPLSVTSDKSTECYRNWWPGPGSAMVDLMNRSIDLLEEHARASGNRFHLDRRGYVYATARPAMIETFEKQAREAESLGAGPLRRIVEGSAYRPASPDGFGSDLTGADLILDRRTIAAHFPYLNPETVAVIHARRCGSLSAQQLGMYLLERARESGARLINAAFVGAETEAGRLRHVRLRAEGGEETVTADALVLATGPYINADLGKLGLKLPVQVEKHIKISMADVQGVVPRDAPLIIWTDPIKLPWSDEEKEALAQSEETRHLIGEFPAGVHGRPTGQGNQVLMYWTYDCQLSEHPVFPLDWPETLPEITLRGMSVLVPGLRAYFDPMPRPYVDGGYYTKAPDNRPLIGPLAITGAYVSSAYSGYGIMASCAGGELLAQHVTGKVLPSHAAAFLPSRFDDAAYVEMIKGWDLAGQL